MTDAPAGTLDQFHEVQGILTHTGVGLLARTTDLRRLPGRNRNWICTTDSGARVFVKKLEGPREASAARVRQCLSFEQSLARADSAELFTPRLLGADPAAAVLVFSCVDEAKTAVELMREERLTHDLAHSLGHTVGLLHNLPTDDLPRERATNPLLPSEELLEAIPLALFESSSAAELQVWALLQNDADLIAALRRLLRREREAETVAAHCDLRLDQFLVADDGRVHLTDFEEFRAGDPARDLGGVVGDLLYRTLLAATARARESDQAASRDRMVTLLAEAIGQVRPLTSVFWSGYHGTRTGTDGLLAERVTAFAGWYLLDRLLAGARSAPRLAALPRAMAGIGRKALLAPDAFVATLGLTEVQR
ncbi:class V lanthionine synthetase subunit LxmK [Streptomyces sp. NPDC051662]|uniref:class V lanthionine synthetase subunit LxmK n=1 Tax=Streptomyces sp. NPDC051662 TaxID=3154750 RepID=UPI003416459F